MSTKHNERSTRHLEFPISKPGGSEDQTFVGVAKRDSNLFPIHGTVFNDGAAAFTLTPMHSTDNEVVNPYGPLTVRVDGAAVTSIVVNIGGIETFIIERMVPVSAVGSVLLTAQPTDTETVTIDDGAAAAVVFEFDANATATGTSVLIGATLAATVTNLIAAINADAFTVVAVLLADGLTVGLYNTVTGTAGNVTITEAGADITVTGMAGGAAATTGIDVLDFLRFQATDGGYGRLVLGYQNGELVRRDRIAVP
jgi:hypothetical protein